MNLQSIPATIKRDIPTARLPINYEAARTALVNCVQIDECKEWSDRAIAIASYARQIKDQSMFDSAKRIRVRAQVRIGELLAEMPNSSYHKQGREAGISHVRARQLVQVARLDRKVLDRKIEASPPASVESLIRLTPAARREKYKPWVSTWTSACKQAAASSGANVVNFQKWTLQYDPVEFARQMTPEEATFLRKHVLLAQEWLDAFEQHLPKAQ